MIRKGRKSDVEVKRSKCLADWIREHGRTKNKLVLDDEGTERELLVGSLSVGFGVAKENIDDPGQYFEYDMNHCIMSS